MLHTLKHYRIVRSRGYRPINFAGIRVLMSLLMLLLLAPASAAPTSALLKGIMQESSSKPATGQSQINLAVLIEEIKKKLAATNTELALVPSETVAGSAATGLAGDEEIFARRLHLRQLVFLYQGQLARLASLQARQQHRIELESQAANWSGFSEPSVHPFLRADELKESVTSLSSRVDELESWIPTIDQAGVQVINTAENSTVKLRQADEAVEQAKDSPDQQARLGRERDLLVLQNQIDLARAMGFQIEKQAVHEELLETQAMLQLANKQLSVASEHVELTQQDLDQVHKNIEIESQHIIAELKQGLSALDLDNKTSQQESLPSSVTGKAQRNPPSRNRVIRYARRNEIILILNCKHLTGYWFTCKCKEIFGIFAGFMPKSPTVKKPARLMTRLLRIRSFLKLFTIMSISNAIVC